MACGALQRVRQSLGLRQVGDTPVKIDHALIFCRFVGLGSRSVQHFSLNGSKSVALSQPDHYREIWNMKHASHSLLSSDAQEIVACSITIPYPFVTGKAA